MSTDAPARSEVEIGDYQYGFHDSTDNYEFKSRKGLDAEIVTQISEMKKEPEWMRDFRLRSLEIFESRPMPDLGRRHVGSRFQRHLLLHESSQRTGPKLGRRSRRHPQDVRPTWNSGSRKEVSGGREGSV